jgi:hypothetical protein
MVLVNGIKSRSDTNILLLIGDNYERYYFSIFSLSPSFGKGGRGCQQQRTLRGQNWLMEFT